MYHVIGIVQNNYLQNEVYSPAHAIGDQNQQMIQEILSCFEMKNPTKDKRAVRNAVARKITM